MAFDFKKIKNNTLAGVLLHLLLAISTFIILAIVYFYVYLPKSTNHGETITVPNIEGKSIAELERELANRSLRFEISDSSYSEKHQPLSVIKQYPHAGAKVKEGRKIFISLNASKPPTVPVPNLIDGSVVNAEAVLRSNQLKRGRIEVVPGPFFNVVKEIKYQGAVIEPLTRVPKGSVIDLVVMNGGDEPTAPDVVGLEYEDAKFLLLGNQLTIATPILVGDTLMKKPVVIKQKPAPGENMKVGDAVELWIGAPGTEAPDDEEDDGSI
jgi:eukaryotic-like serine/threonine-protein kinase